MYIILILKFNFFVRHSDPEFVEGEESLANARIVSDKLRDPSSADWRPPTGVRRLADQDDSRVYPRESEDVNF